MADDDRENGGTPDPWEGIEAEAAGDPAADMTFSLDEGFDETLALPDPSSQASGLDDEFPAADLSLNADAEDGSVPVLQWESEDDDDAAGIDATGIDGAGDAVGDGDGIDAAAEAPADKPLALFPPTDQQDAEAAAIDIGIPAEGGTESSAAGSSSISVQSSSIQIGTGRSGIVSLDEWADAAADSVVEAGGPPLGDDGAAERVEESAADDFPFDDDAFSDAAQGIDAAADDAGLQDAEDMSDPFAAEPPPAVVNPPAAAEVDPFAAAFGDLSLEPEPPVDVEEPVAAETVAAAGAAAATAPAAAKAGRKASPKPVKKRAKQGGIGQMIGVVLGGLMALPITYAILVWGFQKDPFKLTKMAPPEVAFLLPQKFRAGAKRPADSLPLPTAGGSLDDLATMAPPPAATSAEPPAPAADANASPAPAVVPSPEDESASTEALLAAVAGSETPATTPQGDVAATAPATVPTPEPLDLSALTAAVQEADAAVDSLLAVDDPEDPVRLKLLKGWYKSLARVGEELTQLETVAAETGRPLQQPPEPLAKLQGKIAGSPQLMDDLGRLGRMWLKSQKRRADGVILLGTFGATRKVGPFWHTRVVLPAPEGEQPPEVSLISRTEPVAAAGESVVATGVVFDADVVWAAECRRVEAMKAAAADDLF